MSTYIPNPNFDLTNANLTYTPTPNFDLQTAPTLGPSVGWDSLAFGASNQIAIEADTLLGPSVGWDSLAFGTNSNLTIQQLIVSTASPLYEYVDGGSWIEITSNLGHLNENTVVYVDTTQCVNIYRINNNTIYAQLPAKPVGEYSLTVSNTEHGSVVYPTHVNYIDPSIGPLFQGNVPVRMMDEPYPPPDVHGNRTPNRPNSIAYYNNLTTFKTFGFSLSWVHKGESVPLGVETINYLLLNGQYYSIWRVSDEKYAYATINPSGTLNVIPINITPINLGPSVGWDSLAFGPSSQIALEADTPLGPSVGWDSLAFGDTYSVDLGMPLYIGPLVGLNCLVFGGLNTISTDTVFAVVYSAPICVDGVSVSIHMCNYGDEEVNVKLAIISSDGVTSIDYFEDLVLRPLGGTYKNTDVILSGGEKIIVVRDKSCDIRIKPTLLF